MRFTTIFFDLDDTLYPADSGLWTVIKERINLYMHEKMGLTWQEIPSLRQHLYRTYGTTMRGLKTIYDIDELDYLAYVHDIPLQNYLQPIPNLRETIENLPQRKFIFTNADHNHARRVIHALELDGCFEKIIDILAIYPYCKPMTEAYRIAMQEAGETDPYHCVFIDDSTPNVTEAHRLGFYSIRIGKDEASTDSDANLASLVDLKHVLPNGRDGQL